MRGCGARCPQEAAQTLAHRRCQQWAAAGAGDLTPLKMNGAKCSVGAGGARRAGAGGRKGGWEQSSCSTDPRGLLEPLAAHDRCYDEEGARSTVPGAGHSALWLGRRPDGS